MGTVATMVSSLEALHLPVGRLGLSSGSEATRLGFPATHTLNTQDALPWELRQYTQSHSEEKASL